MKPEQLRADLQHGETQDLWRRRAIIGLSLAGMTSMTAVSLLQTGILEHLPDPPLKSFNSDKVNSSDAAYRFGAPDGTMGVAGFALNVPIAAFGGASRATEQPLVPLAATAKAAVDGLVAGWYFYQMPAKEHAWCGYCIAAALSNVAIFALTLPEASKALAALRGQ